MVKYFEGTKARSILCVPMVVGGEVIGAIHMWNKRSGSFNSHDNKVMKSVASSLATAIASSRLHQMCQRLTTEEVPACETL
jgi:GAF domain-containing protein